MIVRDLLKHSLFRMWRKRASALILFYIKNYFKTILRMCHEKMCGNENNIIKQQHVAQAGSRKCQFSACAVQFPLWIVWRESAV